LKKLSQYNPNDYCFCHVTKGVWEESKKLEEKKRIIAKKNMTPEKIRLERQKERDRKRQARRKAREVGTSP
jgi:hypothetical protein